MRPGLNRRKFIAASGAAIAAAGASSVSGATVASKAVGSSNNDDQGPLFKISLAQWSLHRKLRAGKLDNLDFAKVSKEDFGINAVEYVSQFFADKADDPTYLKEMLTRAGDLGVESLLIMVDREGRLGDPDTKKRMLAAEKHHKWVDAAKFLGCHSIRVNASSDGDYQEQVSLAVDGLSRLCEYAAKSDINVIVENHGGLSSNGQWLAQVIRKVNLDNCGTLPDFGNFRITKGKNTTQDVWYDRYVGTASIMPFAKSVSAKSHDFDDDGNEVDIDYLKMLQIMVDAGYRGHVGIEYEGKKLSESDGIKATKNLLEKCRTKLS